MPLSSETVELSGACELELSDRRHRLTLLCLSGGVFAGIISQHLGRRLTIIIFVLLVGAFIPLWIIPSGFGKPAAGAFCVQFGVQGAWGVVPIFLAEMSPPAFRATFPGVAYQLGNVSVFSLFI